MRSASTTLTGLIAAPHTPFHGDGSLNLATIQKQAEHLIRHGIKTVFAGGSTGECHSLSVRERFALAERWIEIGRETSMQVILHVGSNSIVDSLEMASQANRLRARAIAAVAPSYFRPPDVAALVAWCEQVSSAAPETPFYYYDIPICTHLSLNLPEFIARARERLPSFAGLKFSNPDLLLFQECAHACGNDLQILSGLDELLLPALVFGGRGAVGATYNFAAPIYHRLIQSFEAGDLEAARQEQFRSLQMIRILQRHGFLGATKAVMKMAGVDVGPTRLPNTNPSPEQTAVLRKELEGLGFFRWITES